MTAFDNSIRVSVLTCKQKRSNKQAISKDTYENINHRRNQLKDSMIFLYAFFMALAMPETVNIKRDKKKPILHLLVYANVGRSGNDTSLKKIQEMQKT